MTCFYSSIRFNLLSLIMSSSKSNKLIHHHYLNHTLFYSQNTTLILDSGKALGKMYGSELVLGKTHGLQPTLRHGEKCWARGPSWDVGKTLGQRSILGLGKNTELTAHHERWEKRRACSCPEIWVLSQS